MQGRVRKTILRGDRELDRPIKTNTPEKNGNMKTRGQLREGKDQDNTASQDRGDFL